MDNTLFYYSTNTHLSHFITRRFYKDIFYVWCSPVFKPSDCTLLDPHSRIPRSSSPYEIYCELQKDVLSKDYHSARIESNKIGLRRGASLALEKGVIDEDDCNRINWIIEKSQVSDFHPILYIIHADKIRNRIKQPDISIIANPLSTEYIIEDLKIDEFNSIQF